ncbi:DUF5392 family protein [Aquibacillus sediminis]|uniref:DUF5392 family protein n=1 Tax=Aquibacillus sediminis TaxID=2574734 RepID=UPI0011082629|nr:DUF5392 family protein [Aquibacillus sediminis]
MSNFHYHVQKVPKHVQKELENIQELIHPIIKKRSLYVLLSIPLLIVSVFNIIFLLFFTDYNQQIFALLIVYGLLGAIGLALRKESKYKKEQIKQLSNQYMIERIKKSHILSEQRKQDYTQKIKQHPIAAFTHFVQFLSEEENKSNWYE